MLENLENSGKILRQISYVKIYKFHLISSGLLLLSVYLIDFSSFKILVIQIRLFP